MPAATTLSEKQRIIALIKKFRFEELESSVLPVFPEFSWNDIKTELVTNHESLSTNRAIKIIEEKIKRSGFSKDSLIEREAELEVIDISRHYRRRVWYTLEFRGKNTAKVLRLRELEEKVTRKFSANQIEMKVTASENQGLVFLAIKPKPKKGKKTALTAFFCLVPKERFFFFCRKTNGNTYLITPIVEALEYQSHKNVKLFGRNIPSLVRMLQARKVAEQTGGFIKTAVRLKKTAPEKTSHGLNFTQHNQRKEFANQVFGEDPPVFETLSVISNDEKWKHNEAKRKFPNDLIYTGVRFRSSDVANFLKELVIEKVLETPLPCYAANLLTVGRNQITIKRFDDDRG